MTTNYTPGPWAVISNDVAARPFRVTGDGWTVADVRHETHREGDAESNARLIAASPELLAALEAVLPILERLSPTAQAFILERKQARAAIAKAKGE